MVPAAKMRVAEAVASTAEMAATEMAAAVTTAAPKGGRGLLRGRSE